MASYKHTSLGDPGRMIRILALHPAQSHSAALSGTLTQFSLCSPGKALSQAQCHYEALSYVWGAPGTQHTIRIDSSVLPITANCDAALRSLRQQSEDRLLWVDSICIDQTA
ncbi:heterokaryon incompatibility protein-domain-containing protein [Diaporthe sp. PMI_573]|nr:heterokaryon incompatibility protein-domain-containing protein [Diaporthaceae sp. PMI_573]